MREQKTSWWTTGYRSVHHRRPQNRSHYYYCYKIGYRNVSNSQSNVYVTSNNATSMTEALKQFSSRTRSQILALWKIWIFHSNHFGHSEQSISGSTVLILSNRPDRVCCRGWRARRTKVRKVVGIMLVRLRPRRVTNDKTFRWAGWLHGYRCSVCRCWLLVLSHVL